MAVDGLLTALTNEVDKAEAFLMGRVEEAQRRVQSLRLPPAVREVQRDTVEASDSETSTIAAERLTESTLHELYKQVRRGARHVTHPRTAHSPAVSTPLSRSGTPRDSSKMFEISRVCRSRPWRSWVASMSRCVAGERHGSASPATYTHPRDPAPRLVAQSHFPPPMRQPEVPPLAALAGSSHVLGTSSPEGAAGEDAGDPGAAPAAPSSDSLHQRREEVEARIAAFLDSLRSRPLHDVTPLDQLDRKMEVRAPRGGGGSGAPDPCARPQEFLREVPARWRKRRVTVLEPAVPVVTKLDLVGLPLGCQTRLKLALGTNHLSFPHSLPVVVARGGTAGPTVVVTSAVHGNELNGIPLIHRLMRELDCDDLAGTLVLVPVVNVAGYVRQQREFSDGVDINRIMPGRHDGNCSQQFAHKLMQQLLSKADFLLDLHTASFGRVNSLYVR